MVFKLFVNYKVLKTNCGISCYIGDEILILSFKKMKLQEVSVLSKPVCIQHSWQRCWNEWSYFCQGPLSIVVRTWMLWNSVLSFIHFVLFLTCSLKESKDNFIILKHKALREVTALCICNVPCFITSWNRFFFSNFVGFFFSLFFKLKGVVFSVIMNMSETEWSQRACVAHLKQGSGK